MAAEIAAGNAGLAALEKTLKLLGDKTPENQRFLLSKNATVAEARAAFEQERGKPMRQSDVRDEDGFRFSEGRQKEPLWKFSSACRLTLSVQDSWSAELSKDLKNMNPFKRSSWCPAQEVAHLTHNEPTGARSPPLTR